MDTRRSDPVKAMATAFNSQGRDAAFKRIHGDKKAWEAKNRHMEVHKRDKLYRELAQQAWDAEIARKYSNDETFAIGIKISQGSADTPLHLLADRDLLAAHQREDREPGNTQADKLLAEIERRGLDV